MDKDGLLSFFTLRHVHCVFTYLMLSILSVSFPPCFEERDIANEKRQRQVTLSSNNLKKMFSKDQIKALGLLITKEIKWSNDTRRHYKFSPTGYKTLQELQIPLPAITTLQRRMNVFSLSLVC